MIICKNCGWAIQNAQWNDSICDDCAVDIQIQHNKRQGIKV
jgi:NMD protein affecting ribosome stability and mRNA decay